jgi:predicted acyltransferase
VGRFGCRAPLRNDRTLLVLSIASTLGGLVFLRINRRGTPRTAALLLTVFGAGGVVVAFGYSWAMVVFPVSRMWRWLRPRYTSGHDGPRDEEGEPP